MTNFQSALSRLFSPTTHLPGAYFHWVDLLRGCAALVILVWHYPHIYFDAAAGGIEYVRESQPFYSTLQLFYKFGYFAVQLFWLLSGFVFAAVYAGTRTSGREFFVNRFARLYPLHFATLVLVAVLQFVSYQLEGTHQIYGNNDARHFLLNLLFISHWGFQLGDSFNAPIWSVSVEIFIYIVFWLLLRRLFALGIVGPLLMTMLFAVLMGTDAPGPFWECGVYFFGGCLIFSWLTATRSRPFFNLLLGIAGMLAAFPLFASEMPFTDDAARMSLYGGALLCAASADVWGKLKFSRYFTSFGNLTYSLYLLHVPVQIVLILTLDQLGINRRVAATSIWFFIAFFALMFSVAWLCYRFFEVPARQWVRRAWLNRQRSSFASDMESGKQDAA